MRMHVAPNDGWEPDWIDPIIVSAETGSSPNGKVSHAALDADPLNDTRVKARSRRVTATTNSETVNEEAYVREVKERFGTVETSGPSDEVAQGPLSDTAEDEVSPEPDYTTLYTLPRTGRPEPLIPPFLAANGATILYGLGGQMKGFVALHLALQLIRAYDYRVMVLDYEYNPEEWSYRALAMGYTDDELKLVDYISPYGEYWVWAPQQRGPLNKIAKLVRTRLDIPGRECDYVIVDSYTPATSSGDALGGAPAAQEFFTALQILGRPSLTLAHVAAGGERFPDKPFGSVFIHNYARMTWAVAKSGDPEDTEFDSVDGTGQMTVELRNKKSNAGAQVRPQFMKFDFRADGMITVSDAAPETVSISNLILEVLKRSAVPLLIKEIVAAIKANTGTQMSEATARTVLNRHDVDLFIRLEGAKGKQKWAARP